MTKFTKDPSTHPANGPLTEERLIRVRDELAAAAKRSDGGNLGYMMADAAKAIEELLALRKAGQDPVADVVAWHHPTEERTCDIRLRRHDLTPGPLYAAPQLPQPAVVDERAAFNAWNNEDNLPIAGVGAKNAAWLAWQARATLCGNSVLEVPPERPADSSSGDDVEAWFDEGWNHCRAAMLQGAEPVSQPYKLRDGWVAVPKRLSAENGAKAALIGEFNLEYSMTCHECFGEGCEDCSGEGSWTNTVPIDWATIKDIWAKAIDHFAAAPQQGAE
ncbi:MAG: hypothetical protein E6850_09390 [Leclercia adecarboxylata]|nr:hypothetical protein [Leclercia adecarboxylata]